MLEFRWGWGGGGGVVRKKQCSGSEMKIRLDPDPLPPFQFLSDPAVQKLCRIYETKFFLTSSFIGEYIFIGFFKHCAFC
jgi:hypothetical protein